MKPQTAKAHNQAQGVGHVETAGGSGVPPETVAQPRGVLVELDGWLDNQLRENGVSEAGSVDFRTGRSNALAQVKRELARLIRGGR